MNARDITSDEASALYSAIEYSGIRFDETPVTPPPQPSGPKVTFGYMETGVTSRMTSQGKTIEDLIQDEARWNSSGDFVAHVTTVASSRLNGKDITTAEKDSLITDTRRSGVRNNGTVEEVIDPRARASDALTIHRNLEPVFFDKGATLGSTDQNGDGVRDDIASLIR